MRRGHARYLLNARETERNRGLWGRGGERGLKVALQQIVTGGEWGGEKGRGGREGGREGVGGLRGGGREQ